MLHLSLLYVNVVGKYLFYQSVWTDKAVSFEVEYIYVGNY